MEPIIASRVFVVAQASKTPLPVTFQEWHGYGFLGNESCGRRPPNDTRTIPLPHLPSPPLPLPPPLSSPLASINEPDSALHRPQKHELAYPNQNNRRSFNKTVT